MFKVREFQNKDTESIIKLIVNIVNEILSLNNKELNSLKENLSNIKFNYFQKGGTFLVGEYNCKIVGTIAIIPKNKNVGILKRMYVDNSFREKGFGKKLYNSLENWCKLNGYNKIILSTYPPYKSLKFYEKLGFKKFKEVGNKTFYSKDIEC